jgi:hypothetical protein
MFSHLSCIMLLDPFCTFLRDSSMMRTGIDSNYRMLVLEGKNLGKITLKQKLNQRCRICTSK